MSGVEVPTFRLGVSGVIVLAVLLSPAGPAKATTYLPMSDATLADQAEVIAELVILGRLPAVAGRAPVTEYHAQVANVIKGDLDASAIVVASNVS